MTKLNPLTKVCGVLILWAMGATALPAQTLTTLVNFNGTDGNQPNVSLVQGIDGNLYGTTTLGGTDGDGTVFKMTPTGTLATLHGFTGGNDGRFPYAGLLLGTDGNFYGTTSGGGANLFYGTVFKITSGGMLTTLHSFDSTDGSEPLAGLVQAANGSFYGTTASGGANHDGTVFKITPEGALTTLYNFGGTDGAYPMAALIQAANGNLYGTTYQGGANGLGTVFKVTLGGMLTTLHSFAGYPSDGEEPYSALVQASNGSFYGTTWVGGADDDGTVFKITSGGTLTTLHSFDGGDGGNPAAALIQATNGSFYSTANEGGSSSSGCPEACGTVFKITSAGALTTLLSFDSTDGSYPFGGLVQATSGTFYGTTHEGGTDDEGTVFSLAVGLGPFVETLPTSGEVGAVVKILGNNLTSATSVTFNGTAATFTVVSGTEITTTVPTGAVTGTVQVVTTSRTLSSNVPFTVN
jgi:uncharacterized repeat protein (TIGR03803 family)